MKPEPPADARSLSHHSHESVARLQAGPELEVRWSRPQSPSWSQSRPQSLSWSRSRPQSPSWSRSQELLQGQLFH